MQDSATITGDKELGTDPATGMSVILKKGPYGWYVQLGNEKKPKRASVNKSIAPESVTLEMALSMLALPREVGNHPESKKPIVAGVGRFGPYLLHDGKYTSLKGDDDVLTIGINRAVDVLAAAAQRGAGRTGASALRTLGNHPDEGSSIAIYSGKYGPYIKFGKLNITLPKSADVDTFSLDEAVALIAEKGGAGKKKSSAKKAPAKKAAKKDDAEESEVKAAKPKRKKAVG